MNAGATPRVNAGIGANVAPRVNAGIGANVGPRGNAGVGANAGARTSLRPVLPGGDIRANVNQGLRANIPGVTDGRVRTNVDGRANIDGRTRIDGRTNIDGRARIDNFLNPGVNARTRADFNTRQNFRPSWFNSNLYGNSRINANLGRTLAGVIGASVGANVDGRVDGRFDGRLGAGRADYWGRYGLGVNNYWRGGNRYPYFGNRWWAGRNVYRPFGYFNYWGYRPWGYWWGSPGWVGVNRWYSGWGWNSPYYYDYGPGGNVVYRDNYVYVDGTNVGTTEEYALSAAALATVDPSEVPSQRAEDWLALGTFAVVETRDGQADSRDMMEPTRFVQLAVDKNGFVAGTYYKKQNDEVYAVSGRVDKETQRLAFSFDTNRDIVFETGIYNLTQDQTPVLVHQGPHQTDTFVFVRLEKPEGEEPASIDRLP